MLAVVEGGSTKADWLVADNKKITGRFQTIGFNPMFHTSEFVADSLRNNDEVATYADAITELHYFGAGCSSAERNEIIAAGLRSYFTKAKVTVDHDLLACAYATCGDNEGIACIIGTGSNSCYFDGKTVHEKNYGLGYILGDEGSGSYYGKKLVTAFLYGLLPKHLHDSFAEQFHLDKNSIIRHVYAEPNANVWLASLSKFLSAHRTDAFINKMIKQGMTDFLQLYVCHYHDYKNIPVHFVGSIAFYFSNELKEVAASSGIHCGKIIKQPVDELMQYFMNKPV